MIYAYHLIVCLFLIVCQTTLLAGGNQIVPYDLLGLFAVFLGIHRPPREAIPVLIVCGLLMDGLSGGPFGVHLTVYLWMYTGVRWAIQYLHVGNVLLLPLLVTAGVAFESLVMAFAAVVLASSAWPMESIVAVVSRQVLWGAATGPFLILFFIRGVNSVNRARKSFFAEKDQLRTP